MHESLSAPLSIEDLRTHTLAPSDAAALVAGVADQLIAATALGERLGLPADSDILIEHDGRIRFGKSAAASHDDLVPALANLLRRLLDLDSSSRPTSVPGSLMVLMARSLGEIDLPRPHLHAFRDALLRVAPDAAASRARVAAQQRTVSAPTNHNRTWVPPAVVVSARRSQWRPAALAFAAGALATVAVTSIYNPGARHDAPHVVTSRPPAARSSSVVVDSPTVSRQEPGPVAAITAAVAVTPARRTPVRQVLTDVNGIEPFSPSFSPDGHALYFHAGRANGQLMRAQLSGDGGVARIEPVLADGASNFHVVPSPIGSAVAFDSDREGVRAVFVADRDGGNIRRVSGPGFAAVPTWSPDGERLAFVKANPNSRTWNVWVADVTTGRLQQVSHHRVGQSWGASWFPDGRRLAYSREDQLVIVDLLTGQRTTVGSPRQGRLIRTPSVSPDGGRVVFQVHGDGVWVLDVARGRLGRVLTDRSAEEFRWSPDGRQIAYHARRDGRWGVWTVGAGPT